MQDTKNLVVAEYAHQLAVATYRHTESFLNAERFGITSQMRRAAVSIASNIAEGCGRRSNRELVAYLYNASGSTSELAAQIRIATELGFGDPSSADQLSSDVKRIARMLSRLVTFHRNQPAWRQREGRH